MYTLGRICIKIAGRDAGQRCVVVQGIDKSHCLIDGQTRRRKCNFAHLEPTDKTVEIKEGASHDEVVKALKGAGIEVKAKADKPKKAAKQVVDSPVKPQVTAVKKARKAVPKKE